MPVEAISISLANSKDHFRNFPSSFFFNVRIFFFKNHYFKNNKNLIIIVLYFDYIFLHNEHELDYHLDKQHMMFHKIVVNNVYIDNVL